MVDLRGTVLDEREHQALRALAEKVSGVKVVDDHLCWIELVSGCIIAPPEKTTDAVQTTQ